MNMYTPIKQHKMYERRRLPKCKSKGKRIPHKNRSIISPHFKTLDTNRSLISLYNYRDVIDECLLS